jgi:replicative DNA helicase
MATMGNHGHGMEIAFNIATNYSTAYGKDTNDGSEVDEFDKSAVAIFTLNPVPELLPLKMLAQIIDCSVEDIRCGKLIDQQFEQLTIASNNIHKTPIYTYAIRSISIPIIIHRVRHLRREQGLKLIVIDGIELFNLDSPPWRLDKREMSVKLKQLATELNVPILLNVDLGPTPKISPSSRPSFDDFPDMREIEKQADMVLLLHREGHYVESIRPQRVHYESQEVFLEKMRYWDDLFYHTSHHAEIKVSKNTSGLEAIVQLHYDLESDWFCDRDTPYTEPY